MMHEWSHRPKLRFDVSVSSAALGVLMKAQQSMEAVRLIKSSRGLTYRGNLEIVISRL